jgi:tetratricopeptide (TPR) repeat protein
MFHSGIVKSLRITALAGCVLALVAANSATAQLPLTNEQEFTEAMTAAGVQLEEGNYEEAIDDYSNIIQQTGSQVPGPFVGRAKAFEALQEFQAALKDYSDALELENEGMQDNLVMASAYNGRGEITLKYGAIGAGATMAVTNALADFTKAIENDRSSATYLVNYSKALVQLGGAQQALASLRRALRIDENNAEAYRTRGLAHAALQRFEEANQDIAKATELEPDNHENHYTMGMIFMQAKMHLQAVEAFTRAKQTYKDPDPEYPVPYVEPYLAASLAYIELGKEAPNLAARQAAYSKAIEETQKALDEQPMLPLAYLNRGVALRLLELYQDALTSFTQAINMVPGFGEAYYRRGIVWYHMGDRELARKDFREAIAINYDDVRPYLWTGITYADEEKYHDAIIQYGEAINLHPRYVPAYINRGLAYTQLGEFERAADNFSHAISLEPTEATHYFKRGSVLMAMDRYDEALRDFSSAISHANFYVDAYRMAAEALRRLGRADMAAEYAKQANDVEAAIRQRMEELQREAGQPSGQGAGQPATPSDNVLRFEDEPVPADPGLEGADPAPAVPAPAVPALPLTPAVPNPFAD